jgi:hypothetical protein
VEPSKAAPHEVTRRGPSNLPPSLACMAATSGLCPCRGWAQERQADVALAKRIDPTSNDGNALTNVEIEPLHHSGIDLPATRRQHLRNGLFGAKHHPVLHPHHAFAPVLLDDMCIEQAGQRYPARFAPGSLVLKVLGLHPPAKVAHNGRQISFEPIAEAGGYTTWCQHACDLVHHPLHHLNGSWPDLDGSKQLADGIDSRPPALSYVGFVVYSGSGQ